MNTKTDRSESYADQLSRLEQMSKEDETWDLSDNDRAAIEAVLLSHRALVTALKSAIETIRVWHSIHDANDEAWNIYRQHAPEMKRLNAALATADEAPGSTETPEMTTAASNQTMPAGPCQKCGLMQWTYAIVNMATGYSKPVAGPYCGNCGEFPSSPVASSAGPSPSDEAIRHRDEAASELDLITSLLSDRSEPGTYAKVDGLLTAWEARDEAIRTLIAQWKERALAHDTEGRRDCHACIAAAYRIAIGDVESLVGAIERQDDKS